jgi:hypothetical protein
MPGAIIAEANRLGIALRVDGADLVYRGPRGALKPDLLHSLQVNKRVVIDELLRRARTATACPCPVDVAERAAIIAEETGCDREQSDCWALAEYGFPSWQALAEAHCANIAIALDRLDAPCDENGRRLLEVTEQFVTSRWFAVALESGWTTLELFGIHNHAPMLQFEQWGLVAGLALAPRPGDTIKSINGESAVIHYRSRSKIEGATRIQRRFTPAEDLVPWWECKAIQGGEAEDWTH